jgi:hypothetical protein
LRNSFDFPYKQIASILELKEAATRQLVARARKRISAGHMAPVSPEEHRRLLAAFLDAAQSGDLEGLKDVLVADVVSYSDGGGKVPCRTRANLRSGAGCPIRHRRHRQFLGRHRTQMNRGKRTRIGTGMARQHHSHTR